MAGKITDAGGQRFLNILFGTTAKDTTYTLQLYTDSNATTDASTTSTHTVPTGQAGYADYSMSNDASVTTNGSGIPIATWAAHEFSFTGPLDSSASIIGYQVITGTTLLFAETLPIAFTPVHNGDTLIVTPSIILGNGTPT